MPGQTFADYLRATAEDGGKVAEPRPDLLEAIEIVDWWRAEHAKPLSRVAANLRYYAAEQGPPIVAQRLKRLPTLAGKLLREPTMKLSRMADIGGVRAVLPDQASAYRTAARLRRNWTIIQFRDYVANPKPNGYRALHLINRNRGRLIEVQLRTPIQDRWANTVEAYSRTVAPGLKFDGRPEPFYEFFVTLAESLASEDQGLAVDPALFAHVKELAIQVVTVMFDQSHEP